MTIARKERLELTGNVEEVSISENDSIITRLCPLYICSRELIFALSPTCSQLVLWGARRYWFILLATSSLGVSISGVFQLQGYSEKVAILSISLRVSLLDSGQYNI